MPELPEVETVVRTLRRCLTGRLLARLHVWKPVVVAMSARRFTEETTGTCVVDVRRRGKWILIDLTNDQTIMAHLRMTGRLGVVSSRVARARHDHLAWVLDNGDEQLRFNDMRRFGRLRTEPARAVETYLHEHGYGPEPFTLSATELGQRLGRGTRSIKAALLDQSVVAGLGNIYVDEILFAAGIDPRLPTARIGAGRTERIHTAMLDILERAIAVGGTSIQNYVAPDGRPGAYREELQVFRRTGLPCPVCGRRIGRLRLAGRSTHFCTRCQHR